MSQSPHGEGTGLLVEPVSEIDSGWEFSASAYRVYFWTKLREASRPGTVPLWESDCYRVSGTRDVERILVWAHEAASGRVYTIYVEVPEPPPKKAGLVQIYGNDPTAPEAWE